MRLNASAKTNFGQRARRRSATVQQKLKGDASLMGRPEKGLIFPIVCFYVELKRNQLTSYWGKMNNLSSRARPVAPSSGSSTTRRQFLARIRGGAGVTLASSAVSFGSSAQAHQESSGGPPGTGADRVLDSYQVRVDAARAEASIPVPKQMTNGDEQNYRNFIGNFHKGLPHNNLGEVIPNAYRNLLNALSEGTATALEKKVTLGGSTKLVNCLAGLAFDAEGTDSHQLKIPPFPKLASQELADQAVELYWMALCRDVSFTKYETDSTAGGAAAELSSLND